MNRIIIKNILYAIKGKEVIVIEVKFSDHNIINMCYEKADEKVLRSDKNKICFFKR